MNTSSKDKGDKQKQLEENFHSCLNLIKDSEKLIHNPEHLKDFRTELALGTLNNPYLSMYMACLQHFVECNQKLTQELWGKFHNLYEEEIEKLKLPENLDDTISKDLLETCPV